MGSLRVARPWVGAAAVAAVCGVSAAAHAAGPQSLSSTFYSPTPHPTIAGVACALDATARVEGVDQPIDMRVLEDTSLLCWTPRTQPGAVHVTVQMTADVSKGPGQIVVEVTLPDNATQQAATDLQSAAVGIANELQRRLGAQPPPQGTTTTPAPTQPAPPPTPPVHTHPVSEPNYALIGVGAGAILLGWGTSALIGVGISESGGDPGTPRFWPYVPFFGMVAFSATYREAANCDCSAGRVVSLIGSVVIDALQVAGVVMIIAGVTSPRTKQVPDTVGLRVGPGSLMLEGTF